MPEKSALSTWMPIAALIVGASLAMAQTAAKTVTISGIVVDDSGTPVAGTKIYYNNAPTTYTDKAGHTHVMGPVISSNVLSAKDGTYNVAAIPPGVYWLCAEGLNATQIRSCDWGFGGAKVDLTTTASATNQKLQVHSGVTLTFQVADASNQIQDYSSSVLTPGKTGNFRIFVVDGSRLKLATPVSAANGVHQYALTVPSTRSLRLLVDSKLSVTSQKNTTEVAGTVGDTISISGQPVTYKLTVQ